MNDDEGLSNLDGRMEYFSVCRECPICQELSTIYFVGGRRVGLMGKHSTGPALFAVCEKCGYKINFAAATFYPIFGGWLIALLVAMISARLNLPVQVTFFLFIFTLIVVMTFPIYYMFLNIFKGHINKTIRKKLVKCVKKGKDYEKFWGDKFLNKQNLRADEIEYGIIEHID